MDTDGKADHEKTVEEVYSVVRLVKRLHIACAIAGKFAELGVEPPCALFEYTQPHFSKRSWESVALRARILLRETEGASKGSDVEVLKTQNSEPSLSPTLVSPMKVKLPANQTIFDHSDAD